jgi:hypothetical protein
VEAPEGQGDHGIRVQSGFPGALQEVTIRRRTMTLFKVIGDYKISTYKEDRCQPFVYADDISAFCFWGVLGVLITAFIISAAFKESVFTIAIVSIIICIAMASVVIYILVNTRCGVHIHMNGGYNAYYQFTKDPDADAAAISAIIEKFSKIAIEKTKEFEEQAAQEAAEREKCCNVYKTVIEKVEGGNT